MPLTFERGEGVWLIEKNGDRYLDFAGGIAVSALGHCHPALVSALAQQASRLWHTSNLFEIPDQARLATRLAEATFADKVFFTNSGAEALECTIKTARRYHFSRGNPERVRIIAFERAFHGRTLATANAGGTAKDLEGCGPKVEGFDHVPFADVDAVETLIGAETAGILLEPVQGEGGVRVVPDHSLRRLRELCDRHGLLLMLDEVQCGVGRTGKLFAHEWCGVAPDIMAIAKGIGGGFPLGACLATAVAARGMVAGVHGTTFGGNQLAMAVGNALLDVVLADGFLDEVWRKALLFGRGLGSLASAFPHLIEGVRGKGLMLGLKCGIDAAAFNAALRAERLLAVPASDNVIRFLPALTVTDGEIQDGLERIGRAAAALSAPHSGRPRAA